jgi:putative membrane protein
MNIFIFPVLASIAIVSQGAMAQSMNSEDRTFVNKVAQAGNAEIAIGKIAVAQSTQSDVRNFAQQMIDDHTKAGDELGAIAGKKNMAPPTTPDSAHQKLTRKLEKLHGRKFDDKYINDAGVKDHKEVIALFESEIKNGSDPDVRSFAEKTLPTIKHHYEMAQQLATNYK